MTTNRMGLEQSTLSDGELTVITDTDHVQCGDAAAMARELLAYRKAGSEPVAYIDDLELNRIKGGDSGVIRTPIYGPGYQDARIPLYAAPPLAVTVPDGWVMVPKEPTEDMIIAGFESEPDEFFSEAEEWEKFEAMSGCEQAAHKARLCWAAMIAAAPSVTNEP